MQLGSFEVPERRLVPCASEDIKTIYDNVKTEQTKTKDLASYLGYSHATSTKFYIRLKSMVAYGLLEGRGRYKVSELGQSLAYPENDAQQTRNREKAVLNVELWKEIQKKFPNSPPQKNTFWVSLKNITGIEPQKAQEIQSRVLKWYEADMIYVSRTNNVLEQNASSNEPSSLAQNNQTAQQLEISQTASLGKLAIPAMGTIEINDDDTLTIARSYLDVLEKRIKQKTQDRNQINIDPPADMEESKDE